MNLNEDRKAPLREKDLSTKREMVVQYISATAKSVSETFQIPQGCICKEAAAADIRLFSSPQSSALWLHALSFVIAHAHF